MQTASLHLPASSFSGNPTTRRKAGSSRRERPSTTVVFASKRDYNGRLVDENMIVLRKRIHETKMAEMDYEPPSDWMEWEKKYALARFDSDVCDAMGWLQSSLIETRPCLALGMMALVVVSLPASTAMVVFYLVEMVKGMLAGAHLG